MSNISSKVMIDPSLIVVERALNKIENNIIELSNDFSFYISSHFYEVLRGRNSTSPVLEYFRYSSKLVDLQRIIDFLEENTEHIQIYEMPAWAINEYRSSFEAIVTSLPLQYRSNADLHNILFEEWLFLKEHSWLIARTKRIFNLFIRSGAASLEFGGKLFDQAVRRSLRLPKGHLVSKAHRLSAMGKWFAVSGAALANLSYPIVQVITDLGVGLYFILFDP